MVNPHPAPMAAFGRTVGACSCCAEIRAQGFTGRVLIPGGLMAPLSSVFWFGDWF